MDAESPVTPAADTDPDSPCPSPYFTAPSSPKHTRQSSNVAGAKPDSVSDPQDSHSDSVTGGGDDFAFELSGDLDSALLSADELFDSGVIRALKPPPGLSQQLANCSKPAESSVSTADQPFPRRRLAETCRRDTGLAGSGRDRDRDLKSWWFGTSSCSSCSFRSCWKWRVKDLVSFRSSGAGEAKRGDFRFRTAAPGNGDSVPDRRFEKTGPGSEVLNRKVETAPSRVGLWGCMRFNHCAAHGLCKGLGNGFEWMTTDP